MTPHAPTTARRPAGRRHLALPAALTATVLVAGGGLLAPSALAQIELSPQARKHAPAPEPDRILTTITGDAATSRTVAWRTDDSVEQGEAQIIEAPDLVPQGYAGPEPISATSTTPLETDLGYTSHYHRVDFEDLTPDTRYLYRVGDAETATWSAWTPFTTAAQAAEDFSFTFLGDAQNDMEAAWTPVVQQAFRDGNESELLVHPGDLVNVADRDAEWGEWMTAAAPQVGTLPVLAGVGNHEYYTSSGGRSLTEHWPLQFPAPDDAPEGHPDYAGTVWSTDYQGVRFISLNSAYREAEPGDAAAQAAFVAGQTAWLEERLADNPNRWTVVFFHHPTYSTATGRNNQLTRDAWKPLLERHGVDLVLSGHDHTYGRGHTLSTTGGRDRLVGPMYVNSVSGPKMYEATDSNWTGNGATIQKIGQDVQLYQLVDVSDRTLRLVSKTATGAFYDGFEITKRGDVRRLAELTADDV